MAEKDLSGQLADALRPVLGPGVAVDALARSPGGASRETWIFRASGPDGLSRRLVLRRDPPGSPPSGLRLEGALLLAARRAGVPVPGVVVVGDDDAVLGAGSIIMDFIDGETIPRRILRDDGLAEARGHLAADCGRVLAAIHRIAPAMSPVCPAGIRSNSCGPSSTDWDNRIRPSSWPFAGWGTTGRRARPRAWSTATSETAT